MSLRHEGLPGFPPRSQGYSAPYGEVPSHPFAATPPRSSVPHTVRGTPSTRHHLSPGSATYYQGAGGSYNQYHHQQTPAQGHLYYDPHYHQSMQDEDQYHVHHPPPDHRTARLPRDSSRKMRDLTTYRRQPPSELHSESDASEMSDASSADAPPEDSPEKLLPPPKKGSTTKKRGRKSTPKSEPSSQGPRTRSRKENKSAKKGKNEDEDVSAIMQGTHISENYESAQEN